MWGDLCQMFHIIRGKFGTRSLINLPHNNVCVTYPMILARDVSAKRRAEWSCVRQSPLGKNTPSSSTRVTFRDGS